MVSAIFIGNITRKPELSYTPNTQTAVCRFSIAVNSPKRNGEEQEADFYRITVWGKQGETCERYLDKGRKVAVFSSRIKTGSYDKDGVKIPTFDVIADRVEFLDSGSVGFRETDEDEPF